MKHDNMFGSGWEVVELTQEQFWGSSIQDHQVTKSQLLYVCQFALLAPTTHNTQPERFKIISNKQQVELYLDRHFVLPQSDVKARQALISLGAVLHHLKAVAAHFGLSCTVKIGDLDSPLTHVALDDTLRFVKIATCTFQYEPELVGNSQILKAVKARKNVRALYDKTVALPEAINQSILKIVHQYPLLHTHIITNQLAKQAVAKFQEQADRYVMENEKFARELGDWLLPNHDSSLPYAMRGSEFGFDDEFADTIHNGLVGKSRLFADQIATFAKGGKAGIESSSAILVITSTKDDPTAWLLAGQLYDEICLMLVEHEFVTAMHAALTEVDWASAVFKTTLLKTTERPLVLLRIGRPVDPSVHNRPHAVRPGIQQLIIK